MISLRFFIGDVMSGIIERLYDESVWREYCVYKATKEPSRSNLLIELFSYVETKGYEQILQSIKNEEPLPHPIKKLINKSNGQKKRAVYTFPSDFNFVMKCMAYQLKSYDHLFAPNLYSFRRNKSPKHAWDWLMKNRNLSRKYIYKVDISNYFCSISVPMLLTKLESILKDNDAELFRLLKNLLTDPFIIYDDTLQKESKGAIPGAPFSAFLANVYLMEMDWFFYHARVEYFRYSDDILILANNEEELQCHITKVKQFLSEMNLKVNMEKEVLTLPGQKWEFLGFSYEKGIVDVSDISFSKLKAKMRRKSKALLRWAEKKKLPGEYAAKAFIKRFNAKLYENTINNELTWTRWYFPIINTDRTLKQIDSYMLDCIRFLASGRRTKIRYNLRYENIKSWGYRSLVHEYYSDKEKENQRE